MSPTQPPASKLPHHTLVGYQLCLELVKLIARTRIGDAQLRQQLLMTDVLFALTTSTHEQCSGLRRHTVLLR